MISSHSKSSYIESGEKMDLLPVIFIYLFIGMISCFVIFMDTISLIKYPAIMIMLAFSVYSFNPVIDPSTPTSMSVLIVALYVLGFGGFKWLTNWMDKNG